MDPQSRKQIEKTLRHWKSRRNKLIKQRKVPMMERKRLLPHDPPESITDQYIDHHIDIAGDFIEIYSQKLLTE